MRMELLLTLAIPLRLDLYMPVPPDNQLTTEKVELGRRLFFDKRLSADGSISCASCHDPSHGFADSRRRAIGVFGREGRRHTPTLINRGYGRAFFWDSRSKTLEEQVLEPIADPNEMGSSLGDAAVRVGVSPEDISRALASFVRSILSGNSRFDRFINGDRRALNEDEQAGLQMFRGKANCVACHAGPQFSDERLHNTGVTWQNNRFTDVGAGRGDFKTPTLREIGRTFPYMHDGSLGTLEAVIDFYDRGGRANPFIDPELRPLRLTSREKTQLLAFLGTLSGELQEGAAVGK